MEIVPIRQQEALQAIQLLQRYEEQQDDACGHQLRRLAECEVTIRGRIQDKQQQRQITSYFVSDYAKNTATL